MDRLRVLHLTTELPHPTGVSGGSVRQFRLLAHLAHSGAEITVVCPVSVQQHKQLNPVHVLSEAGIELVATSRRSSRAAEAIFAIARRPQLLARATHIPMYGLQTEMLSINMKGPIEGILHIEPDVVTIEHDYAVRLAELIPDTYPKILTFQNVSSVYYHVRAEASTGIRALAERWASLMAERYVSRRLGGFDLLVSVSDQDATLVRNRTDTPVAVIPNGTNAARASPSRGGKDQSPTVLFTGTMNHPPNNEGVLWFYREIWPAVANVHREARLVVVGRQPQKELMRLAEQDARVEVTGSVADMAPYYEQATVAIAPLRSGSGTRLKILDALAASCAVVTTTIGCEGLDVNDGEHLLIADKPEAFAACTIQLLSDHKKREQLAVAGRRLVVERYDWDALAAEYDSVLREVADRSHDR